MPDKLKVCCACGASKPRGDFNSKQGKCKPCQSAYHAKWVQENAEHKRAYDRAWRLANLERKAATDAAWRKANAEHYAAYLREWHQNNKVRAQDHRRTRRARVREAFDAPVYLDEILVRDSGICGICGKAIMEVTVELDHVIPVAAGGRHGPDNVQLAHRTCNRQKATKVDFNLRDAA